MKKYIALVLIASLSFTYLVSCGGGNGNGDGQQEFRIFDVTIRVLEVESLSPDSVIDCPESANLKLSLSISGNNITGFAELLEFGKIGDAQTISGLIQDNEFTLDPFGVGVISDLPPDADFPASSISFDFQEFQGVFMHDEVDEFVDRMEGQVSGKVFRNQGDLITCDREEFTGEFTGISRSPEGRVSPVEAPTLECSAEGFVNQCDAYAEYFCFGWCEPLDDGIICVDPGFNASQCEVIDCLTVSCPGIGPVNLEGLDDFGSFQYVTPVGTTQTCS